MDRSVKMTLKTQEEEVGANVVETPKHLIAMAASKNTAALGNVS
jgi:hypothetical protein